LRKNEIVKTFDNGEEFSYLGRLCTLE